MADPQQKKKSIYDQIAQEPEAGQAQEPYEEPGFLPAVSRFMSGEASYYRSDDPTWQAVKKSVAPGHLMETGISAVGGLIHGVVDPAVDVVQRFPESVFGRDTTYGRFIEAPLEAEEEKAQKTPGVESVAHSTAGLFPVVGPFVSHVGEKLGTGDVGGTAVEVGTQYLAPKVVGEVIGTPGYFKEKMQRGLRTATGAEDALREEVTKQAQKYATDKAQNVIDRRQQLEENINKRHEQTRKDDLAKIEATEQNKRVEAETARQRRTDLQSDQDATNAQNAAGQLENRLWQENNRLWNGVKERVGTTVTEPVDEINQAVGRVEAEVLQKMPDSLPQLKQIKSAIQPEESGAGAAAAIDRDAIQRDVIAGLQRGQETIPYGRLSPEMRGLVDRMVEEDINRRLRPPQTPEAGAPPAATADWNKLQRIKTVLEEQIRNPRLNATYRYALRQVQDAVVNTMGRMADAQGARAEWQAARDFTYNWRKYFHDQGSYGKALLEARSIPDVQRVLRKGQSASGNYLSGIFRTEFGNFGGNEAAAAVDQYNQTFQSIGKKPPAPTPVPEVFPQPTAKPLPPVTEQPVVDARAIAHKSFDTSAKSIGRWNARDAGILMSSVVLGPWLKMVFGKGEGASNLLPEAAITYEGGKYAISRALRNSRVRKFMEGVPQTEMDALNRIPGSDKVIIQNAMTQDAINAARSGIIVRPTNAIKAFLGDRNVRLIMAAQAQATTPVQTPGEAKQVIPQPVQ